MTEYPDKWIEDIASEFIVGTCQLLPKSFESISELILDQITSTCESPKSYSMDCGSSAEFHIRPLNPLINDCDTLLWDSNALAFTDELPVIPNDVSHLNDTIICYKIEPYPGYLGFVWLRVIGELNYNWARKQYTFIPNNFPNEYMKFNFEFYKTSMRGPSIRTRSDPRNIQIDTVHSVWCPQWPKEAQHWPKRRRYHGLPTNETIVEVVEQGCHVVYVQHRACRGDGAQFRYSFSAAETILLQRWTQIQQIVYHLLRFLSNKELIEKDCSKEDEVLCTYHLKTLMLWTCEEMPSKWWNSSFLFAICSELIQKLSEWLQNGYCPNYFIPEANLFYELSNSSNLDKTKRRLSDFSNSGLLCQWIITNYIQPVTEAFDNKLEIAQHAADCVLDLSHIRQENKIHSFNILLEHELIIYNTHILTVSQWYGNNSCLGQMQSLRNLALLTHNTLSILPIPENVSSFRYFDMTMFSLLVRNGLSCGQMSWDGDVLIEYIKGICFKPKIIKCQYHNSPKPFTSPKSQVAFLQVEDFLINLTGLNSPTEFQLLTLLLKEFLRRALECDDSQSDFISSAALLYLAALYFTTMEKKKVINICSLVLADKTIRNESETLNAGCLFFIDDIVRVIGFYLLSRKFSKNCQFNRRQLYLDLRLSAKVLAYYLIVKSAEVKVNQLELELNSYWPTSTFALDQFLLALTNRNCSTKSNIRLKAPRKCVYSRPRANIDMSTAIDCLRVNPVKTTEKLVEDLTEYALENLTLFYSVIRKDCGIQGRTVDCYRALHLYKQCEYGRVLYLCERILHDPDLESDFTEIGFANVLVLPPFDSFFDEDMQSLLGFNTIFCYLSLMHMEIWDSCFTVFILNLFAKFVFSQRTPGLSSDGEYNPYRCHYSVGRHFLARYLKVRCCIDCHHPCETTMAEFVATRKIFPFEHIVHQFVLQKSRKT